MRISSTLDDLDQVIKEDHSDHPTKELGLLLVAAMNDWPGIDCSRFDIFCKELKDFYGDPVTLESIENKQLDRNNAIDLWKHEAGAAVAEMIELSNSVYNEDRFDKVVERIINYYKI